ncbi:MAG: DUF6709 family protein [Erysipelotrichaceae bacterium]
MDKKEIKKLTKKSAVLTVMCVITVLATVACFLASFLTEGAEKSYYQLELEGYDFAGQQAYINIVDMMQFAQEEYSDGSFDDYYIVFDDHDYVYFLCIEREKGDKIFQSLIDNLDTEGYYYTVSGTLFDTTAEIEQLALEGADYFFDWQGSVTMDDYDNYFLHTYLIEGVIDSFYLDIAVGFLMISLVLLAILLIKSLINFFSGRNADIKHIRAELANAPYYRQDNTVISENYILYRHKKTLNIYKLSELYWVYDAPYDATKYSLICHNRNSSNSFGVFENKEIVQDLIDEILTHNSNIIVGYSKENRELYQNRQRQ